MKTKFVYLLLILLFALVPGRIVLANTGGLGGSPGNDGSIGTDGLGGYGGGGGGGGGSASGGSGSHGAGGGIMIKSTAGTIAITGSVDTRGGNTSTTNGGTVKIFWFDSAPSITGVYAGRIFLSGGLSPAGPQLIQPQAGETGVMGFPTFRFRTSDPESNNLQYKIEICSNSDCSTILRTIDQTLDQTGWFGQNQLGGTAYSGSNVTSGSTIATYRIPTTAVPLTASTQYWWRVYAYDPGGSNIWGPASSIQTFTVAGVINTQIGPGSQIIGGGHVQ